MIENIFEQVVLNTHKRPFEIKCNFQVHSQFTDVYNFPVLLYVGKVFFSLVNEQNKSIPISGGYGKKFIGIYPSKNLLSIIDLSNKTLLFEATLKFERSELSTLLAKLISMDFFKVKLMAKEYGHIILAYYNYELFNDDYDKLAVEFDKVTIPAQLKKPNGKFLYRGLVLSKSVIEKIQNGKKFTLQNRKVSSWSFDRNHALGFIKGQGVLLKEEASKMPIILNANNPDIQRGVSVLMHKNEKECLVKGTGVGNSIDLKSGHIDSITFDNIVKKINLQNFVANQPY